MNCRTILQSLAVAALSAHLCAQSPAGRWDASVTVNDVEIPFRFEVSSRNGAVSGSFFNGDERVTSTSGSFTGDRLRLAFDHYATRLDAQLDSSGLKGAYGRAGRMYPFQAKPYTPPQPASGAVPSIAGAWTIPNKSPKGESAWRFIVRQSGPDVSAAILRIDGDTGTLAGSWRGSTFVLSHFSGARPLLVEVTPQPDGTLEILQNRKTRLTAVRSTEGAGPQPADPHTWTSVKDPSEPLRFGGRTLDGKLVTESDPRFSGKVIIVSVSGSWCPNCHDEAPFLAELYQRFRDRGLEIVTLSFEEADQLSDPARLRAFIAQYGIQHTVLLAGEPSELRDKLPQAVNLNTWPATFFLGRDGRVRATHAGFASRASGDEHTRLKAGLTRTVERLLAEQLTTGARK